MFSLTPALLLAFGSMVAIGIGDVVSARPARELDAPIMVFIQKLIAIPLYAVFLLVLGVFPAVLSASPVTLFEALLSALINLVALHFFFIGFKHLKSGVLIPIANAYALPAIFIGIAVFGEYVQGMQLLGIALVIGGIIALTVRRRDWKGVWEHLTALRFAFLPMLLWGINISLPFALVSRAIGGLPAAALVDFFTLLFVFIWKYRQNITTLSSLTRTQWRDIALVSFLFTLGLSLLAEAMHEGVIAVSAAIAGASPFVSVLFARWFLKEKLTRTQYVAVVVIICGITLLG